jgi:hypothetical protein
MDVSRLFLHVSPTGLQKVARRNCASSLVELAAAHAGGAAAPVTPSMLTTAVSARPAGPR